MEESKKVHYGGDRIAVEMYIKLWSAQTVSYTAYISSNYAELAEKN